MYFAVSKSDAPWFIGLNEGGQLASLYSSEQHAIEAAKQGWEIRSVHDRLGWMLSVANHGATHVREFDTEGNCTKPVLIAERIKELRSEETVKLWPR